MSPKKERILIVLILLTFLSSLIERAFAYIPCMCNNPPDQCACFIQLGDQGLAVQLIIEVLQERGYLQKTDKKKEFTPEVRQAVIKFQKDQNIECTGWMDDDTLSLLLTNRLPKPSVKYEEVRWRDICFVPTDGGQKYHTNPACSDMYNPRLITRLNAELLGMDHCGKWTCPRTSEYQIEKYSNLHLTPRVLPEEYYVEEEVSDLNLTSEVLDDTATTRSLPTDNQESVYIGNKKSHVFHSASCNSVKDMSEKNKIEFQSRDEAITKGYKPCSRCNP